MTESRPNALARRQILAATEHAIRDAGVQGQLPTPLHAVEDALGVKQVVDMADLPPELADRKPKLWKRILGAYLYQEETIFVDRSQGPPRVRFAEAHELGHKVIPWHKGSFQLDDSERIFGDTEELLEAEAKLAGAHLVFQGTAFRERALDYATTLDSPIALADDYGVSMHVTIRHYVEQHPEPVAVLITGRYEYSDGSVPVWTSVASESFETRYGSLLEKCAGNERLAVCGGDAAPLGDIVHEAMLGSRTASKDVKILDRTGTYRKCVAEAFFNQYTVFVMCSERRIVRQGRRLRVQAG